MDHPDVPLVLQSIEELAMGCEGRSNNPVSVFFDCLNHPGADMGEERPSLLRWESRPDLKVNHMVIGKGRPGGCWQSMEGDVQTVSLGSWMELPNRTMSDTNLSNFSPTKRAKVSSVAQYYQEYVNHMDMNDQFLHNATVTRVHEMVECEFPSKIPRSTQSTSNLPKNQHVEEQNAVFQQEHMFDEEDEIQPPEGSLPILKRSDFCEAEARCYSCSCSDSGCSCGISESTSCCSSGAQETLAPLPRFERSTSLTRNSLSTTPHGLQIQNSYRQFCIQQNNQMDRKFSDCHLEEYSARDGDVEDVICAWDPIVNPELFCSRGSYQSHGGLSVCSQAEGSWVRRRSISICSALEFPRPTKCTVSECFPNTNRLFAIEGFTTDPATHSQEHFQVWTKNLVLATGMFDRPNDIDIPGEQEAFVYHSLKDLEAKISCHDLTPDSDPVLVVGAGLSAADAVRMATGENIPILHAFRRDAKDPNFVFKKLPKALYPEYHEVFRMMTTPVEETHFPQTRDPKYLPLPAHQVLHIGADRSVTLVHAGQTVVFKVSYVVVLTGSLPDLSFLAPNLSANLGILKNEPISRNNPVDIDIFTNEVVDEPGVYAMGPLVGDNFVRFLQGGALAIASHILQKSNNINAKTCS
ncbi:oxidative stress-induced growth inhibitor 1-like isoform X2 [Tigriopus californicus]|nr:oxidative stress-induced growth inhibitor 1-like isoform X2 [Tigriopus californicus]